MGKSSDTGTSKAEVEALVQRLNDRAATRQIILKQKPLQGPDHKLRHMARLMEHQKLSLAGKTGRKVTTGRKDQTGQKMNQKPKEPQSARKRFLWLGIGRR